MRRDALLFFIALLLGLLMVPAEASAGAVLSAIATINNMQEEPSMEVSDDSVSDPDGGEAVEIVEAEPIGPIELDYLESINTYAMYIFAFGVVWLILKICSLVYKLLRIFI